MHGPKVDRSIREAIVAEYLSGGVTLRELEKKYGYHFGVIGRWTRKYKQLPQVLDLAEKIKMDQEVIEVKELPEDVRLLQDQLRMANLKNQLLEAMLDIGKEQYGLDLRKKSGTKPS
jgi:transposase-like protein